MKKKKEKRLFWKMTTAIFKYLNEIEADRARLIIGSSPEITLVCPKKINVS
jgi:hypothetical protein